MSREDYNASRSIANKYGFYACLMAAMRNADWVNEELLRGAFPDVWRELSLRYNTPGGVLTVEQEAEILDLRKERYHGKP